MSDDEDVALTEFSRWRSLLPGGSTLPFAILFLAYASFDVVIPSAVRATAGDPASPYLSKTSISDSLGGAFEQSDLSAWSVGLFIVTVFSTGVQRAVLAVWVAFGCGTWPVRLGMALIASACLYAMIQAQLSPPQASWQGIVAPFAAMPLESLSLVTPLAIVATLTGRRLQHKGVPPNVGPSRRRFSIADLLLITAVVAVGLALARWKYTTDGEAGNAARDLMLSALVGLVLSTICVLPIVWTTLAVHRHLLALLLTGLVMATFVASLLLMFARDSEFGWLLEVVVVGGALLNAPCGLLLWRLFGYRLTRVRGEDVAPSARSVA